MKLTGPGSVPFQDYEEVDFWKRVFLVAAEEAFRRDAGATQYYAYSAAEAADMAVEALRRRTAEDVEERTAEDVEETAK